MLTLFVICCKLPQKTTSKNGMSYKGHPITFIEKPTFPMKKPLKIKKKWIRERIQWIDKEIFPP